MTLSLPSYIEKANVHEMPVEYEWKDERPALHYGDENMRLRNRISDISYRGIILFCTGCAEWVVWRLSKASQDDEPFLAIEAAQAATVDIMYFNTDYKPDRENWRGPIRGALFASSYLLRETICDVSIFEPAARYDGVCLSNLTEHVLLKHAPFRKWRKATLDRLAELFPYDKNNKLGSLVPKELLDSNFEFSPESSTQLMRSFLSSLDYKRNPYLRSPEEMLKAGFKGTPYSL
jgi:hypothetical protein